MYRGIQNPRETLLIYTYQNSRPRMMQRLDERILELCRKAVATPASPELEEILEELRQALHEHVERLRKMVAHYPTRPERRKPKKD